MQPGDDSRCYTAGHCIVDMQFGASTCSLHMGWEWLPCTTAALEWSENVQGSQRFHMKNSEQASRSYIVFSNLTSKVYFSILLTNSLYNNTSSSKGRNIGPRVQERSVGMGDAVVAIFGKYHLSQGGTSILTLCVISHHFHLLS